MARLRSDFDSGTITDNPLTSGAATINSAGFASLPVVTAPDLLAIVLDPDSATPEIVWVDSHVASATSVTALRAKEGTSAREHASGTAWAHTITAYDLDLIPRVLDEARTTSSYTVPPTAGTTPADAVVIPELTISPICPAGIIRLKARCWLNHGPSAGGWIAGRAMKAYVGDATSGSIPIVTGLQFTTNGQLVGGVNANTDLSGEIDYPISPAEAGQRIFKLYVFLTNNTLSLAAVNAGPEFVSWIKAETVPA
jgi:hypothetical protein